jgi:two-component system, NarL family, nitrate/nitrite response regulator NarL
VRVLIVDDSAIIRDRLAVLVGEWPGAQLMEASDADEALAVARRIRPDLVLLDLHMPGKSGLAVIADLKALSPAPVVVVLTNQPTESHRRRCIANGADFFFDKAFDFSSVLQTVAGPTSHELASDTSSRDVRRGKA